MALDAKKLASAVINRILDSFFHSIDRTFKRQTSNLTGHVETSTQPNNADVIACHSSKLYSNTWVPLTLTTTKSALTNILNKT